MDLADVSSFTGCFGGGPGRLAYSTGLVTVSTAEMVPDIVYVFYVIVTKDTRQAEAEVTVNLLVAAAPSITIV